jgi:hypothetical protein
VNEAIFKGVKREVVEKQNTSVSSINTTNNSMFSTSSKDSGAVKIRLGTAKKK